MDTADLALNLSTNFLYLAFVRLENWLQVYPEGTHLIIPWFERPIIYDVRARPHLVESTSGSRDLQMVLFNFHFLLLVV